MKKESPVRRAIEQVFGAIGDPETHCFVETAHEADLIVFGDMRAIEKGYSASKTYGFIDEMRRGTKNLPANVVDLTVTNTVVTLIKLIQKVGQSLQPLETSVSTTTAEVAQLRADALRILVIDDTHGNIASAESVLAGHHLTTVTGYEEAMTLLGNEKFDVVLTDLHLPMSSKTMGSKFQLGELVPYGMLLMVEAARQGAKHVAVITDLSHHDDPFSAAFDHYSRFPVKIEDAKVIMVHAPMKDGVKDWATALSWLMGD
ncbi:MAG: hypothetical protein HQ402_02360 [Parcubacteria group bacterium]|nr:hypothetical protein [Parcubacteria group bacterium]